MNNNINQEWFYNSEINLVDIVIKNRPKPVRKYDQIYMKSTDMLKQLHFIKKYIIDRRMVFLGDDDGMSMLIALFSFFGHISSPKSIRVLDFDERIINNNRKVLEKYMPDLISFLTADLYNVINKVPKDDVAAHDFFYINPPYGAFNNGLSCILWLHRCIELCNDYCRGCVIVPSYNNQKDSWQTKSMFAIQEFLNEKGFVITEMLPNYHSYHLETNKEIEHDEIKSSVIIVEKIKTSTTEYYQQKLPLNLVKNLYGMPVKIPQYILDKGEGIFDFDWDYGSLRNILLSIDKK